MFTSTRIAVGNKGLCPYQARHLSSRYHTLLVQHEGSCYELLHGEIAWLHAESLCQQAGGHLVHINNAQEQAYIQSLLSKYSPQQAVWIGLHDQNVEGHFQWTAGWLMSGVPYIISCYLFKCNRKCDKRNTSSRVFFVEQ